MGLSSFPTTAAEGVLPVLVMNTVLYVALLKNMVRSLLQVMGANWSAADYEENPDEFLEEDGDVMRYVFDQHIRDHK
ncbi:hypothetical protein Tsubulata_051193, partial [Turnera subulata]